MTFCLLKICSLTLCHFRPWNKWKNNWTDSCFESSTFIDFLSFFFDISSFNFNFNFNFDFVSIFTQILQFSKWKIIIFVSKSIQNCSLFPWKIFVVFLIHSFFLNFNLAKMALWTRKENQTVCFPVYDILHEWENLC